MKLPHEVESMTFNALNGAPWHGLGTPVSGLQTAAEAIKAAGLDWTVELRDVFTEMPVDDLDGLLPLPDYKAVVRTTDNRHYAIVKNRYLPIQNSDAFRFFDQVIGTGQAVYETAGSLRLGSRIWILAHLKDPVSVAGEEIKKYLTMVNSHDGSLALQMFWTPVRVVCQNTLTMALARADMGRFYSRHTPGAAGRVEDAQHILGLANTFFAKWQEDAKRLATLQLPAGQIPLLLKEAFGYQPMEKVWDPMQKQIDKIQELVEVGRGMDNPKIKGTRYQVFNAVAEFCDYYRPTRGDRPEARLESAWFGSGAQLKEKVWGLLQKA